jgi:hypothetical protein
MDAIEATLFGRILGGWYTWFRRSGVVVVRRVALSCRSDRYGMNEWKEAVSLFFLNLFGNCIVPVEPESPEV